MTVTTVGTPITGSRPRERSRPGRSVLVVMLLTRLRSYRGPVSMLVFLQAVQTFVALYLPTLNADIIDRGVAFGNTGYILSAGGFMLVVTVVQALCVCGAVFYGVRVAAAVGADLRSALFACVQEFSQREVGRFGVPSLITRATNDVLQVQTVLMMTLNLVVPAPIMGVGALVMALSQDVPLFVLVLVALPLLVAPIALVLRRLIPLMLSIQRRIDRVNGIVREQISGVRVVRAFAREGHERNRYFEANVELRDLSVRAGKAVAVLLPICMLVPNLANVGVVWFGGARVEAGDMEVGTLIAFLHYLELLFLAAVMATFMLMLLPRAQACAGRIQAVLDTETSLAPPARPVVPARREGRVDFLGVDFGYPGADEPVLRDIDLTIRPGAMTAVIGSTGSGKTTLLNLIPRLIDVTRGEVRLDGVDVRDLDLAEIAAAVAVVPQKSYLFSGTVASNLRYGRPEATDDELWKALAIAQADGFVRAMPDRLEARVGQGGVTVSGGQRQRLAIARAVVSRPRILLFDDSFSALDHSTDAALRAALARELGDTTMVIVAQRVATVRAADHIVVLDEGRVVGSGVHTELMARDRVYREIVRSQAADEEESESGE